MIDSQVIEFELSALNLVEVEHRILKILSDFLQIENVVPQILMQSRPFGTIKLNFDVLLFFRIAQIRCEHRERVENKLKLVLVSRLRFNFGLVDRPPHCITSARHRFLLMHSINFEK